MRSRPLRLVLAVGSLRVGGAERNVVRYALALTRRGHEVTVLAGSGPLALELSEAGIPLIDSHTRLTRPWTVIVSALKLSRFALSSRVEIVHSFMASSAVAAALAARLIALTRRTRFQLVVAPPGIGGPPEEPAWVGRARMKAFGLGADAIISPSAQLTAALRTAGVPQERIRHINFNAVDLAQFDVPVAPDWRRGHGLSPSDRVVCALARLDPVKGQDLLIQAAPRVLASVPEAVFILVGEGPRRAYLERLAVALGVASRVRLLGYLADVAQVLLNSDVVVQTTLGAGGPGLSVLEAFAARRPVVAVAFPDLSDAVGSSGAATLVWERDPEAFASALIAVLKDPALARRMGDAGRDLVETRFSLDAATRALESTYNDVRGADQ